MTLIELSWFIPLIIILAIWDMIWKIVAMWYASRDNQKMWYILLAIINSIGVLPILYLLVIRKGVKKI